MIAAVRKAGVKALIEPSSNSPLEPPYLEMRALIAQGALGDPYWFSLIPTGPDHYHPSLGGNPYGLGAFFSEDSGGMLFDFPYAPNQIVTLLGACKNVMGMAKVSVPDRAIVPEANMTSSWRRPPTPTTPTIGMPCSDLPKTEAIKMGAPDNVFSLYEMVNGAIGVFHVAARSTRCARDTTGQPGDLRHAGQFDVRRWAPRVDHQQPEGAAAALRRGRLVPLRLDWRF